MACLTGAQSICVSTHRRGSFVRSHRTDGEIHRSRRAWGEWDGDGLAALAMHDQRQSTSGCRLHPHIRLDRTDHHREHHLHRGTRPCQQGRQPTATVAGVTISPSVTVTVQDDGSRDAGDLHWCSAPALPDPRPSTALGLMTEMVANPDVRSGPQDVREQRWRATASPDSPSAGPLPW